MNLVIQTKIMVNYSIIAENPYWKSSGGNVFLIKDLSTSEVDTVNCSGIPIIKSLVEMNSDFRKEYVVNWFLSEENQLCDTFENPFEVFWRNDHWVAYRSIKNTGIFHYAIEKKIEQYDMAIGGERTNYRVIYVMLNGDNVLSSKTEEYFNQNSIDSKNV